LPSWNGVLPVTLKRATSGRRHINAAVEQLACLCRERCCVLRFASDHIVGPLAALALVLSAFVTICATEVER
jgi:hypothetical protein